MGSHTRGRTREGVYSRLRERILRGELPAETRLNATQLAATLGASRTPIREALLQLVAEGLAIETPRGVVVKPQTEEEVIEVYEVRIHLEALAARLAAGHRTSLHLAELHALHDKFVHAARETVPNVDSAAGISSQFHLAICQAGRNRLLIELVTKIYGIVGRFRNSDFHRPGRLEVAIAEHQALVEAIEDRDPDRAESIARAHMEGALSVRLEMYRETLARGEQVL
jgi:DNA-binding GntR family transcriptional regulator